eukprot:6062668-Amphidinium_carterae.4
MLEHGSPGKALIIGVKADMFFLQKSPETLSWDVVKRKEFPTSAIARSKWMHRPEASQCEHALSQSFSCQGLPTDLRNAETFPTLVSIVVEKVPS